MTPTQPANQTPGDYCLGGQDNAHRVHTATTRLLRCAACGRTWPWNETGDALPFHTVPEQMGQDRATVEAEQRADVERVNRERDNRGDRGSATLASLALAAIALAGASWLATVAQDAADMTRPISEQTADTYQEG